jgi:hypothetical protein
VRFAVRAALALCLVVAANADVIIVPLGDGNLEVRVGFIKFEFSQYQPKLEMRVINHTASAWKSLKLRIDVGYLCDGQPKQYSMQVSTHVGWSGDQAVSQEYSDIVFPLMGKVDKCETQIIRASLLSADSLEGAHIELPANPPIQLLAELAGIQQKLAAEEQKKKRDKEERAREETEARDAELVKLAESERKEEEAYDAAHSADVIRLSKTGPDRIQSVILRLIAGGGRKEKGEFETSEHFSATQSALLEANNRRYIFLKDLTATGSEFSYDADLGTMSVNLREGFSHLIEPSASRTVIMKSVPTGSRRFSAKNAFNVSVIVTSSTFDDFLIAMTERSERWIKPINTEFSLTPERARILKPFLRLALYGTLADPHVYMDSFDTEAKIDDPQEFHTTKFILLMNIEHIDVVDSRTGKVVYSPKRDE